MKNPAKETSPLHSIHVALQAFSVAQGHIRAAESAATKDLNPVQAATSARAAARSLEIGAKHLEDLHALLTSKTLPIPPGPDADENVFRRDFAFSLMAEPSNYSAQTWSGRESSLFEGGSETSIVGIVAPPMGYDPIGNDAPVVTDGHGYPPPDVWEAWLKRTQDVARHMPGVHVPTAGELRGVRAPWNPSGLRVPGIVRDVGMP